MGVGFFFGKIRGTLENCQKDAYVDVTGVLVDLIFTVAHTATINSKDYPLCSGCLHGRFFAVRFRFEAVSFREPTWRGT